LEIYGIAGLLFEELLNVLIISVDVGLMSVIDLSNTRTWSKMLV